MPTVWAARVVVLAVFLLAWQYAPRIPGASRYPIFDSTFISSPSQTATTLYHMFSGSHGEPLLWGYLWTTVKAALIGAALGLVLGALVGLLFSQYPTLNLIARPFAILLNSIPRIALIPVVILITGIGSTTDIVNAVLVVFFLGFFNALEGGNAVPADMLDNAGLLGASSWQLMWSIRRPYVVGWTFAAVPNAVSFALIACVTSEILTGNGGIGVLISQSTTNLDASLAFAVIVSLCIIGVTLTFAAEMIRRRFSWWMNQ